MYGSVVASTLMQFSIFFKFMPVFFFRFSCEFPINQARSSRSRYRPEPVMSSMGNQLGSLRRLRRRQHRRKEGGNRITKLESRYSWVFLRKRDIFQLFLVSSFIKIKKSTTVSPRIYNFLAFFFFHSIGSWLPFWKRWRRKSEKN